VALVGVNGAGKSTLLKMLAGVLTPDAGERTLGTHVEVHYYAQHQLDALDPTRTMFEELEAVAPGLGHTRLRTILGSFLFSGDVVEKRISVLSGGEKARVALAKMLVHPAALLCLDEPTNHLDLASREVLEEALAAFPATIVFISHDRYFINRIATRVVHVDRGRLTDYLGGYDDYLAAVADPSSAAASRSGAGSSASAQKGEPVTSASRPAPRPDSRPAPERVAPAHGRSAHDAPSSSESRSPASAAAADAHGSAPAARLLKKKVSGEVKALRARLGDVERKISALERRIEEIGAMLADPKLYANGDRVRTITGERKTAEHEIAGLMHEWEELSTALAAHE